MQRNSPPSWASIISRAKSRDYVQDLVELGCDKAELIGALVVIKGAAGRETWDRLTGMTPKRLREVTARNLNKAADEIEQINSKLGSIQQIMRRHVAFRMLPNLLREYAVELEALSRTGGEKRHPLLKSAKCNLVQYVKEKTGRFCDEEVSGLLSDILDNSNYDAAQHGNWRREYCKA
jgi:hypothetical protein